MRHRTNRLAAAAVGAALLLAGHASTASAAPGAGVVPPGLDRDTEQPTIVELEELDGGRTGSGVEAASAPNARMATPVETCSAADSTGRQVCVEIGGEVTPAQARAAERQIKSRMATATTRSPSSEALTDVGATAVQTLPQWCLDYGAANTMYVTRTAGCGIFQGTLTVTRTVNGVPSTIVGTMSFLAYRYVYTIQSSSTTWANQIQISPTIITGEAAGTQIWGTAACSGAVCVPQGQTFPTQTPGLHGTADGESYFSWPVVSGASGTGAGGWNVFFKAPTAQNQASLGYPYLPTVRCDQAMPGSTSIGCVIPQVAPHLLYDYYQFPEFGLHLLEAEASGLPGSVYTGVPLHRLTNTVLRDANRTKACPSSLTRPTGKQCDEYPFASTWEGASTGGGSARTFAWCQIPSYPTGITGPTGFSSCMIDGTQNEDAGRMLNNDLYVPYRVIEGDAFYATVIY